MAIKVCTRVQTETPKVSAQTGTPFVGDEMTS